MKVVLKYERLAKPRGGWRYGLDLTLRVEISQSEVEELAPDWLINMDWPKTVGAYSSARRDKKDVIGFARRSDGRYVLSCYGNTSSVHFYYYPQDTDTWPGAPVVYFNTSAEREEFIRGATEWARTLRDGIVRWLAENTAVTGDAVPTVVEHEISDDVQKRTRMIRIS